MQPPTSPFILVMQTTPENTASRIARPFQLVSPAGKSPTRAFSGRAGALLMQKPLDGTCNRDEGPGMTGWRLDPREVIAGYDSSDSPQTTLTDMPSAADVTEYTVWFEHRATGIRVEGKVPHGQYTNKELELLEIDLRKSLFSNLELKVARYLGKTDF